MGKVIGFLNLHHSPSLGGLTEKRPLASVSFLARYAIMDIPMSNFANSDIDETGILVKEKPRSVIRHLGSSQYWSSNTKLGQNVLMYDEPYANNPNYNHDINNLLENQWMIKRSDAKYVVVAPCHLLMKINYKEVIEHHIKNGAKITMVYKKINDAKSNFLGEDILNINENSFVKQIKRNRGVEDEANISLQTYIFNKEIFESLLVYAERTSGLFSLKDTLKYICKDIAISTYEFEGFVGCINSLSSYLKLSLDLLNPTKRSLLFDVAWPIYTKTYDTPPARYYEINDVKDSFIANGSEIRGSVFHSIIGRDVKIAENVTVKNCIILSGAKISSGAVLENVIVDKEANILHKKDLYGTIETPLYIKKGETV